MNRLIIIASGALMACLAPFGVEANTPTVKICTGGKAGNYYPAGADIAEQLKGKVNLVVVDTGGSIDNLNRMAKKECAYAVVQQDSINEWESRGNTISDIDEVDRLYMETFHFIANVKEAPNVKGKFSNVDKSVKVMRDGPDSGTAATWETIKRAEMAKMGKDKSVMGTIPTVPESGMSAVGKVRSGKDAQAMLFMSGNGSALMKNVDRRALGDDGKALLCLVDFGGKGGWFGADAAWTLVKNGSGKSIYEPMVITKVAGYRNLLCGASEINTFGTAAMVVVDKEWKAKNSDLADSIALAIGDAIPNIKKRMDEANKKAQ